MAQTGVRPDIEGRIELQRFTPSAEHLITRCYLGESEVWHTVTSVILDGHHDHKPAKMIKMIQTALCRAGVETPAEFTWQVHPFLKHGESAFKYDKQKRHIGYHRPEILKGRTAVDLRIHFEEPVRGPLAIGACRYRGMGVFAIE